jgi:hypothetical protein
MPELPEDLRKAIESGQLTDKQIRQLIELEAQAIGLSFEQAERLAETRSLPRNAVGSDLQLLFGMLVPA